MSKNRDLIYDMAEAPEPEDFEQLDSPQPAPRRRRLTQPLPIHIYTLKEFLS